MKAFRYIFLTICAFAEASLFAFGITGFIAYRGDPDPNVPTMVVAAVTVCALALLGITIKSFINVSKDREAPVIYGFLLKFPVMIFALGIMWFALGIPEAGWLAVILSIPLAALFICLPRLRENRKKAQPVRTAHVLAQFTRDKAEWVIRHFSPYKVVVFRPDSSNEGAYAYVVLGESEWEPEHGISFTVIGDHVVAFGGYGDAEPPYEEDLQWRYRILEDAARGNYCAAEVIPARFGGRPDSADNQVVVPRAAAERKRQFEDLIEALFVLKLAEHYDCKITYQEGKPNYLFLETTAGSRRTFADSIGLGF